MRGNFRPFTSLGPPLTLYSCSLPCTPHSALACTQHTAHAQHSSYPPHSHSHSSHRLVNILHTSCFQRHDKRPRRGAYTQTPKHRQTWIKAGNRFGVSDGKSTHPLCLVSTHRTTPSPHFTLNQRRHSSRRNRLLLAPKSAPRTPNASTINSWPQDRRCLVPRQRILACSAPAMPQ